MEDSSGTVAGAKTICPRCLQPVEIASGAYSTAKTAMEFVAASSKDEAKMRAILALLGKAANRQITPETFEAEAAKIGPDAAKVANFINRSGSLNVAGAILFAAALHSCAGSFDVKLDLNRLYDQVSPLQSKQPATAILDPNQQQVGEKRAMATTKRPVISTHRNQYPPSSAQEKSKSNWATKPRNRKRH